jgi:NADH:quinone reductase (non-electrogenic)
MGRDRPRVLVLGGGFGGLGVTKRLAGVDADVVLVDRHDYHTFQPLLYQLATCLLETTAVGHSLRDLHHRRRNTVIRKATVSEIDLTARKVRFVELGPVSYDYLVVGLGAEVDFFGVPGAAEHAFPMYTLPDALRLKEHVLDRWEAVDRDPSLAEDGALNVVVVGGGPTGVETAGALAELYRSTLARDFPKIEPKSARIVLVESSTELFAMFGKKVRDYTLEALKKRTVEVMSGMRVGSVTPTRVTLESGDVLKAHTLVWGAGLRGNGLVRSLGLELAPRDRIAVGPDLVLPAHPEVYVVGDTAAITDSKREYPLPQLGSVAAQSGRHAGESIARRIAGKPTKPFVYHDRGTMATIGRRAAVVQTLRGRALTGTTAQLAWGLVHLGLLPSNQDRAKAVVDWMAAAFTHQRIGRITVDKNERPSPLG